MRTWKYLRPLCLLLAAGCGRSTADLVTQANAEKPVDRLHAVHDLRERTGDSEVVIPALVEKLKDSNTYVRRDAARSLGRFGSGAREAVPALKILLRDREPSVRRAATQALTQIDPTAATAVPQPSKKR